MENNDDYFTLAKRLVQGSAGELMGTISGNVQANANPTPQGQGRAKTANLSSLVNVARNRAALQ